MEGFVMLNLFDASHKMKRRLSKGERCKAVLVKAPMEGSMFIDKEVIIYIFERHLFINYEGKMIRTSRIKKRKADGDILHVITNNSEYDLRVF